MGIRSVLLKNAEAYPLMRPTDAVKLVYQATFGGAHMAKDEQKVLEYIHREYKSLTHDGEAFRCESLGNTSRVYLDGVLSDTELSLIAKMFCSSAISYAAGFDTPPEATRQAFLARIDVLRELCREGHFPFTPAELDEYLANYRAKGYPPVSHSDTYREAYSPSYRVIDSRYVPLVSCIRKIAAQIDLAQSKVVITIDGRCASGKTTLASLLADLLDAEIIHMDDFFLPPELRTNERLNETGGNIHYERFSNEVLPNLHENKPFSHRVFDCTRFAYSDTPRTISPSRVVIVEGVYSLHPRFGAYYDVSLFCDIESTEQLERLRRRNGEALLSRFQNEWIPMEERYFEAFDVRSKCDFVI